MAGGSSDRPGVRVALVGLGCRVSRADLDALAASLPPGLSLAGQGERAALVVVGTCTVTADADSASRQAVRRAAREHPGARIVAAGCYAERCPAALRALPGVAAVVGARSQGGLPEVLSRLAGGAPEAEAGATGPVWDLGAGARIRDARPVVKVQDGCDRRCGYCPVPLARGPSRSMPFEAALERIGALRARHPEVVLAGVRLGAYGRELSPARSLAELVRRAAEGEGGRIRLSSLEPGELPLELLDDRRVRRTLCPHLHLPLQSGSRRVLGAMGRHGDPGELARAVRAAAARLPGACLGTDVLVGFPGEEEEDHRETVAMVAALPFAYLHVFPFSPRPGTPAAALAGAVPAAVVRRRAAELRALSAERWRGFLAAQVGRTLEVVVERVVGGEARGTSAEFAPVRWACTGERRGELARVRVVACDLAGCAGARR
ncbi:MAG TPA: MiaB/RimO family radical SAM methylthiotransferase [Anaeromyxobacter sp.]|nr:MiaB/RimO family radical SAM methylthiotransferase [Anaeromyxobacter sp.]